jgi:hypothetical protein
MRIGTTPTHEFTIPFDVSLVDKLKITYSQNGKEVLVKYAEDCKFDGNTVSVTLSQEDTFLFKECENALIQMRVKAKDGGVHGSDVGTIPVLRCLDREVL